MATRVSPPQNKTYYINPAYLTFVENSGYGANLIQVSASSSCYISVYDPANGIGYSDADRNYQRWKVTAYNNKFPSNDKFYIYARLDRSTPTALIVYSKKEYNVDGSTRYGETAASDSFYFIRIGEVSETNGTSIRRITYDTGYLESDQGKNEGSELNEMWELDKYSTPWLIRAKQWLDSFTVKGFVTFIGGFLFKKGETEKPIVDIKRSTDGDSEYLRNEDGEFITDENGDLIEDPTFVPISDDTIPTTKYVRTMNDDRYLSKIKPDETPYHVGLKGGLTTTEAASTDYAEGVKKGGWAAKKDIEDRWYLESDLLVARILARVYDLLVENNAVFKGSLSSEEFISGFIGGKGWAIRMKEWENAAGVKEMRSYAEFDDLIVRGSMRVYEFIVSQMLGENDNRIFTGMMEVDHYDAADGKIYMKTDGGKLYNPFRVDDVIIVQQYGGMPSEDNDYYVTKQYEFIVTEVGVGNVDDGEDRLDWLKFRNFTTAMEGGDLTLITERDTLVRIDNLSDARRKGIIQMMSVGEDTPYMDFIYGRKTDPDNSLKGRFGNIGGIYNPLFGWLKEFGAYLTNLYAVGEFRIAHTGEDVADALEIAKGSFRTNYRQTTFDMTEEENFFTNAAMTNNAEGWVMGEEATSYFLVDGLPQFFNYELYGSEDSFAGIAEHNGRDMLRISANTVMQKNELIDKPGTHRVHTGSMENEDGTYTKEYEEVPDTLYLSVRVYCVSSGTVEVGFTDSSGVYYNNDFHVAHELTAQEDAYTIKVASTWDGKGDFCIKSSGDVYIDLLSLTDKPLENFMITTSTSIEQTAEAISLLGYKMNGPEGTVTNLKLQVNAMEGTISSTVSEVDKINNTISTAGWINSAESVKIFAEQVDAQGIAKKADLAVYVEFDPKTGKVVSGIKMSADQIDISADGYINIINSGTTRIQAARLDLSGLVTVTSLNTTLSGYATDSELASAQATLNNSISTLNNTLTKQIDSKASLASIESLNTKVTELNTALSGKADASSLGALAKKDLVEAVLCGSTLISGGYLNTDYCKVKTIEAVKGTVGGFTISDTHLTASKTTTSNETESLTLSNDGIVFSDKYSTEQLGYTAAHAAEGLGYCPFSIVVKDRNVYHSPNVGMMLSVTGAEIFDDKGIYGNCAIYISAGHIAGFRMKTRRVSTSQTLSNYDNNIICTNTSTITLTFPSNCEDGHEYWFFSANGARVNLSLPNGVTFTHAADAYFSNKRWQVYKYDAVSKIWYSSFMNKDS